MRKTTIVVLSLSFLLGLDVYSGGELSDNQKAIDVTHYYINLKVDPSRKIILGKVEITFLLEEQPQNFEFDLIDSLRVSEVSINEMTLSFYQKNNKVMISNPGFETGKTYCVVIKYGGEPPVAKNPPWVGGFSWEKSEDGRPWVGVSCQANGAYIWYPCKEHPSDKPNGAKIAITVPEPLVVASNGLLRSVESIGNKWKTWTWETQYSISPYNINFTVGNFKKVEKNIYLIDKPLSLVYYVLPESVYGAKGLLDEAEKYLSFYVSHFGQYPWIQEKFGLVETPYWGMEHQTINAYGNKYKKTQLGYDFLLFHEMGHEWWGNYLSVADWADFWIHEGIDTYAEAIFVEEEYGSEALKGFIKNRYKKNIQNRVPIALEKNATTEGKKGNDIYYKGAHVLHTLRFLIGFETLKKTLKEFLHMPKELSNNQTSTKEFIQLIHQNTDTEINWFFDQYLYKSKLPTLIIEEEIKGNKKFVDFRWKEEGFKMPVEISFYSFDGERNRKIPITNLSYKIAIPKESKLVIDPNNWLLFEKEQVN